MGETRHSTIKPIRYFIDALEAQEKARNGDLNYYKGGGELKGIINLANQTKTNSTNDKP
jgi:hypothetical protein